MAKAPTTVNQRLVDEQRLALFSRAEYHERMQGHPTPTQSELDDIKHGIPVTKAATGAGQLPQVHNRQQHLIAGPDPQMAQVRRAPTAGAAAPRTGGGGGTPTITSEEKTSERTERSGAKSENK